MDRKRKAFVCESTETIYIVIIIIIIMLSLEGTISYSTMTTVIHYKNVCGSGVFLCVWNVNKCSICTP